MKNEIKIALFGVSDESTATILKKIKAKFGHFEVLLVNDKFVGVAGVEVDNNCIHNHLGVPFQNEVVMKQCDEIVTKVLDPQT